MRWYEKMSEGIKKGIRNWLNLQPSAPNSIQITEVLDFELNAIKNRIWYRGDGNELEQFYQQIGEHADKYKFWASKCTPGMEMRKIHTGLPSLIVKTLTAIVLADMNDFEFNEDNHETIWAEISKKNKFQKRFKKTLREVLYVGDGAWKVAINTQKSAHPILHWYPGDRIEILYDGDVLSEVVFKTPYKYDNRQYVLHEHYGYGYIRNKLYKGDELVDISTLASTKNLSDWKFDKKLILATPFQIYDSAKWENRGGSIFDGKHDSFDAYDEAWSQWMDALRAGRARTYIPESYIPRNTTTGELMKPNAFDNRFIQGEDNMKEGGKNQIDTEQPAIPHDSYSATYITALDLCLQGIISPSTLGIDTKKLDNAEAQREKEKTTLYTRNAIIEAIQDTLPELIQTAINAYRVSNNQSITEVKVDIPFGEYANPSFESQVETAGKGRQQGVMSIEAAVEELYGDSKDDEWKKEEVMRLKKEQGIEIIDEPGVNMTAGNFDVKLGDDKNASQSGE